MIMSGVSMSLDKKFMKMEYVEDIFLFGKSFSNYVGDAEH